MGLIDLKTDLKSLRYGKDTIGGGYSGQPYIQTPIPESFNDLGANEDFILRGGINAARDAATDIKRLTKMFGDLKSPNGLLFIVKQNVLSNSAVRTQTSGVVNEGIYTPLNTLAQAGLIAFGGHLNKQGENPFELTGAYANNDSLYSFKVKPTQLIEENRLARLYQLISTNDSKKLNGFTLNNGNVLTYDGGPNSILGVGKTNIRFASQRTGKKNPLSVSNPTFFYTGSQKSVNIDDKQVGGLQINTDNKWTKAPLFELPSFSVNSPQSSSLSNIPIGYLTSIPKHIKGINYNNRGNDFKIYNPLLTGISSIKYSKNISRDIYGTELQFRDSSSGKPLYSNNVYKSGSLTPDTLVTLLKSTPPQDITNPNGNTYRNGSPASIEYNINDNKGVTNTSLVFTDLTLGANAFTFQNPSVYKPVVKGEPLLVSNTDKILANGAITYTQQQLEGNTSAVRYNQTGKLIDFRKIIRSSITDTNKADSYLKTGNIVPIEYIDYSNSNIGVKNKIGNPGADRINKDYSKFNAGQATIALDEINASAIGTDLSNDDLVQFRIEGIKGTNIQTLAFRAFLGSITDNYSATINTQQYVGRGENFYTYGGQSRKISLSWTVAALSRAELIPMYKRLSYLASMTAPIYSNGFMQGPLVSLTIGGYIYNLPGYIEGFSLEMAEDATWEIAINPSGSKDNTISQLTHVIKVSGFSFQPIPNYLPTTGANFISIVGPDGKQL